MSRKFLDTESPGWVSDGLISEGQRQRLLARYPQEAPALGLLPILGSVLVGLSGLSVVAANWQGLPTALRLALLLASLVGSYGAGAYFLRRGNPDLGHGLIGLGLILFGASIILVSQLFQLVGYDASGLLAWVVAGVGLSYVYGSRLLVLLTVLIGAAVQTYCVESLGIFSYVTAWLVAGGMGYYWWRRPDAVSATVLAVGLLWQAGLFIIVQQAKITWFFVPAMLVYAVGDWQANRAGGRALQVPSLVAAYLFMFGLAVFGEIDAYANVLRPPPLPYLGALGAVLAGSIAGKRARGRLASLPEWLLLLPGFYFSGGLWLAVATLVVLYAHAGSVLAHANRDHDPEQLTIGAVLFVAATAVAYFKLTWGFMDKSLFFLIGGILLLALSGYLRRRNAQVLAAGPPVAPQAGVPPTPGPALEAPAPAPDS